MIYDRMPSSRHGKQGFLDYWSAYGRLDLPVHLLSCDDVGAFMSEKEQERILVTGSIQELDGTLLGKKKTAPKESDKYAEYVTLRPGSGLTAHILIYGTTSSGKTRGFVVPCVLKEYSHKEDKLAISVKEVNPNPVDGADRRQLIYGRILARW